jgi:radical SAM protein with 4Fe4S-binding SPASM domain
MHKGNCENTLAMLRTQTGYAHPQIGDLNRLNAVVLNGDFASKDSFKPWSPYMVHLSVTGRCNAHCKGCINGCITFRDDTEHMHLSKEFDLQPDRDAQAVYELITKDRANEAVVCFYGGEPLLMPELIADIINHLEAKCTQTQLYYMLYTNGLLLDKTAKQYESLLSKFWLVSVSIDGRVEQHNNIRTGADLKTIHENLRTVRPMLNSNLLMWSTLRESQSLLDCFEEFLYLEQEGLAPHWFWHWVEAEESFVDFAVYCQQYEQDLRHILDVYIKRLSKGHPLSIIHLDELILYLLTETNRGTTGCGVEEKRNFDLVGGRILACADLGMEWELGRVDEQGHPHLESPNLDRLIDYKKHLGCYECGVHAYCGGRCPVEAVNSKPQRLIEYCQLMRLHVGIVQQYMPKILIALKQQHISLQQLYERSAKFAQFTDVTP